MKNIKIYLLMLIFVSGLVICGSKMENPEKKIDFYSPSKGIYIVDVNTKTCRNCIEPYVSDSLETVKDVAEKTNSIAAINAGFFDPKNTKTSSYITKDGKIEADPTLNNDLMSNPAIQPYLPDILNRSEFRIQDCNLSNGNNSQKYFYIARHNDLPLMKCPLLHSVQAGPALVPDFKLYEEDFVVKQDDKVIRESAGALGKYARSAVAIKGDHVLLVAVSDETSMTLQELADYMRSLNVDQAMAFDGGSSTSLYVNMPDNPKFILTSAKDHSARRVKSVILVKSP